MNRSYVKVVELFYFVSDLTLLNLSFFLAYLVKIPISPFVKFNSHYTLLFGVMNLVWILIAISVKMYDVPRFSNVETVWGKILKAIFFHCLIIIVFIFSLKFFYYSRGLLLIGYAFFSILILFWRASVLYLFKQFRKSGYNYRTVIIVGGSIAGNQLYNYFSSELSSGYRFAGFFDDNPEQCLYRNLVKGNVEYVKEFISTNTVDEIYCALPLTQTNEIRKLMSLADNNLIRFKVVPDFRGFLNKKVNMDFYYDTPVLTIRTEPLENYFNRFCKRIFDILFSMCVIFILFPFLVPIVGMWIKLSSPGPIFFKQLRSGRNNKIFACYKFRSMRMNAEADKTQAIPNDPRVTKIGRFLRRTNLDEMPQFFNVLQGHMSVVGPRPHMLNHTEEYSKLVDKFLVRHFVKPGITGWAQVKGFRGPTSNSAMMFKRVKADVWYIENWTLFLDIKIICLTVLNMLRGEKHAL